MTASGRLRKLDDDRQGAVLLMCLAALLMLLLMSWAVLDGIFVIQDKGEVQASADVAAYSQASVKARSMNKIAFANVGKRSIVGAYAVYEAMFTSYYQWLILQLWEEKRDAECEDYGMADCPDPEWQQNWDLFIAEEGGDHNTYRNNSDYYIADLRALDTYQRYLHAVTPWWGWSEAVLRAQRNGATLATTYPPPMRGEDFPFDSVQDPVANDAGGTGGFMIGSSDVARLPIDEPQVVPDEAVNQRCIMDDSYAHLDEFQVRMVEDGMEREAWQDWEHVANVDHHRDRSEFGATESVVIERGQGIEFERILQDIDCLDGETNLEIARYGTPWTLSSYSAGNEANWLFDTSNIVMTYRHQPEYFDGMVDKYERIGEDLEVDEGRATRQTYRPSGYWGLARAEITFQQEGSPDMWQPAWTARMRPVALPDEFRRAGNFFPRMYRSTVDWLVLSAHMHDDLEHETDEFFDDLVYFERAARGIGQTSVEGVGR